MKKFSILFLTNSYPDFNSSYRGIFIKKMASLLQREGFRISVVTPKIYRKSRYFENENEIKVYRFPFFARDKLLIEHHNIPYLRMFLYYLVGFFLAFYVSLKNRCNIIHVHWAIPTGLIGVWVKALLKKALIVTIHGSDLRMAINRPGFLKRIFIYVCKKATHLNCVSEGQKKEIVQLGINNNRISIIPMGVDEIFLEVGKNRKKAITQRPFRVLSNRNLLPIYNLPLLIQAIPIVLKEEPQTEFLIAGDGPERGVLEREVKKLNIHSSVKFLGPVPHQEMADLLARADIYVSTSLYDGTSVSLLEALASGAFPVVSDISSNREWITDGKNGFLFPVDEEKVLARKILEAIHDKELLIRGCESNRTIVEEKAHWPVCIKKVKEIYDRTNITNGSE